MWVIMLEGMVTGVERAEEIALSASEPAHCVVDEDEDDDVELELLWRFSSEGGVGIGRMGIWKWRAYEATRVGRGE
jgi:hypothetical protein